MALRRLLRSRPCQVIVREPSDFIGNFARQGAGRTGGARLDQKLANHISLISTALDAYGRLAADETGTDFKPGARVKASKTTVDGRKLRTPQAGQ